MMFFLSIILRRRKLLISFLRIDNTNVLGYSIASKRYCSSLFLYTCSTIKSLVEEVLSMSLLPNFSRIFCGERPIKFFKSSFLFFIASVKPLSARYVSYIFCSCSVFASSSFCFLKELRRLNLTCVKYFPYRFCPSFVFPVPSSWFCET